MAGYVQCVIVLDKPDQTYFPEETVSGRVEYTFREPAKIRGIGIKLRGVAENSWVVTQRGVTTKFAAAEEYFNISYNLVESKDGSISEYGEGTQSFPFTYTLPPSLPSSFEGEYGHIRYTIKVNLDQPNKADQENKLAFTVISKVDLNAFPQCVERGNIHIRAQFCCFFCKSGPLVLDVDIPVSGYCPGQVMPIDINVENGSNVDVDDISLKLLQTVKYIFEQPKHDTTEDEKIILERTFDGVKKNSSKTFQKSMAIPPLPPSNLSNCSIIDLTYALKVECTIKGFHMDVYESHSITIGTIPIAKFQSPLPTADTIKSYTHFMSNQASPTVLVTNSSQAPGAIAQKTNDQNSQPIIQYPQLEINNSNTAAYPEIPQFSPSAPNQQDISNQIPNPQIPVYCPGQFRAKTILDSEDHRHVITTEYSPRYPTFGVVLPPS